MSIYPQPLLDLHDELIVDLFAGGGGASAGIEMATGRLVDIAINHDPKAVAMHEANHPQTWHLTSDVFEVDPKEVCGDRRVGLLWASPDCTYHSKARGGKPIRDRLKKRRALAWVVTRWAGQVRPRVIALENVEEFAKWGPLVGPSDCLTPCKKRIGRTFRKWVKSLVDLGYQVEWREMRACDYGAPTIRKRLFLIARCDGQPITWPKPTHGNPNVVGGLPPGLKPWRAAAECIDWSIPMCSIFADKEESKAWAIENHCANPIRPLAENTMRRIARGIARFVTNNPKPFIVNIPTSDVALALASGLGSVRTTPFVATVAHGEESANSKRRGDGVRDIEQPVGTLPCSHEYGVVAPIIQPITHVGGDRGASGADPLATITTAHRGEQAVVAPFMVPRYGEREGQAPRCSSTEVPAPAIVPDGNGASLVAAHVGTFYGNCDRTTDLNEPLRTQSTENRHALVAALLNQNHEGHYSGDGRPLDEPAPTATASGANASVSAVFMDHNNTGYAPSSDASGPLHTVCAEGAHHNVVAANLIKLKGTSIDADPEEPLDTVAAQGTHHGVVTAHIQRDFGQSVGSNASEPIGTVTPNGGGKCGLVMAFMSKFYGQGVGQKVGEPAHTLTAKDRLGLITVLIKGIEHYIVDVKMRMLQPKELYACQGFPKSYVLDRGADGQPLTKTEQVRMVGNSVSPPPAAAIIAANCEWLIARRLPKERSKVA